MMLSVPRRGVRVAAALASALALTLSGISAADAHGGKQRPVKHHGHSHGHGYGHGHGHGQGLSQRVLAEGLLSPLRAAVADDGTVYVSQNFAGQLTKVRAGKPPTTVYTDPDGFEVGGVSVRGRVVTFTVTQSGPDGFPVDSWLKKRYPDGTVRTVAHVRGYENANNPDAGTTYGFRDIDPTCAAKWPAEIGAPATYTGVPDSHPYSTYPLPGGWTYIADAGANAIFLVSPRGRIRTVAVLPAIPFTFTAETAAGLGLDPCFAGKTYWFEPVPTDIEKKGGDLYVTSLPGGPEGPELGARGSVFKVNPWSGRTRQVVSGLLSPTGLAFDRAGTMYVAQLFGNSIVKVDWRHGSPVVRTFLETTMPAEVESSAKGLVFTDHALPDEGAPPAGRVVLLRKR